MVSEQALMNPAPVVANNWPTHTWELSTPEAQGMDSAKLLDMVAYYEQKHAKNEKVCIDSITIVRNSTIVADMYFNPLFPKDTMHVIHSCTKSIMSILIGVAIDLGYIESVSARVLDILAEKRPENFDPRLAKLTLKDLLAMQTGLHSQDSYIYEWRGLFRMQATNDWTKYVLSLPMETMPGKRFDYSNMSSFLLSAIITETTGMDTLSFARKHLFNPLGIDDVLWHQSPQGIYIGWARMWLKPHDMAKIGLLYLSKGKWEDQQIVPIHWVEESITAHAFPKKYRYVYNEGGKVDYVRSGGNWIITNLVRPFADGYGYQWWLDKSGVYAALGVGGQYIMVVPQENLVVVVTSKLSGADVFIPARLLKKFILPAIVSRESIAPNETAQRALTALSESPARVTERRDVPALPAITQKISGKTYALESNPWQYDNFQLVFVPGRDEAEFRYIVEGSDAVSYRVGLDNVQRLTESNGKTHAAVGKWVASDTFVINYELVGYTTRDRWTLTFEKDEIAVEEVGVTGVYTYKGKMK